MGTARGNKKTVAKALAGLEWIFVGTMMAYAYNDGWKGQSSSVLLIQRLIARF